MSLHDGFGPSSCRIWLPDGRWCLAKFPAPAVPTASLEMGGAEQRRSTKGTKVRLPAGMAAHQREIHKMSNKSSFESFRFTHFTTAGRCNVDTRKTWVCVGEYGIYSLEKEMRGNPFRIFLTTVLLQMGSFLLGKFWTLVYLGFFTWVVSFLHRGCSS